MTDRRNNIVDIMKQLCLDHSFHIPVANQENKLLEKEVMCIIKYIQLYNLLQKLKIQLTNSIFSGIPILEERMIFVHKNKYIINVWYQNVF